MKKYKIYRLVDPTVSPDSNKYIRYIGWTNKTLSARLSNHITEAKHDMSQHHTYKNRWINKLLSQNIVPKIEFVDDSDSEEEIKNMEIHYIQKYKDGGFILTNATLGGDGQLGRKVTDEQKAQFEKAIDVYDKNGQLINTLKSQIECSKVYNVSSSKVSNVCNGIRKSTGGLVFRFKGEPFDKYETISNRGKNSSLKIPVARISESGDVITIYNSIGECAREENIKVSTLRAYLKLSEFTQKGTRRMCIGKYFTKKI